MGRITKQVAFGKYFVSLFFIELSPELAEALQVKNGDYVTIATLRAAVEARALVSRRLRPLRVGEGA